MYLRTILLQLLCVIFCTDVAAAETTSDDIAELRQMLETVRKNYQRQITELEKRITQAEQRAKNAEKSAENAVDTAEESAIQATTNRSSANSFNPAISAVLVGSFADVDQGWEEIPGFVSGDEPGPGNSGFSLGESELNLNASVDALFFGNLTMALEDNSDETRVGVEEAWVQTTGLPYGFTLAGGRYFSELGYLNKFHQHADDFVDRPLPYQAFLGGQYNADGTQIRWVAPTALFLELGGELNWGDAYPATGNSKTRPGAWTIFSHVGGDVGFSNSWLAGLSYLSADVVGRKGNSATADVFTGDSDLFALDFVWKWAPGGNPTVHNFKVQGEFFWRDENGEYAGLPYDGNQSGWYLQGVWQFMQQWRLGYRHDALHTNNGQQFIGTSLEDPASTPRRDSVMIDWSFSEFSRVRLQYTYDQVLDDPENQIYLQYLMSIGAHGSHEF